MRSARTPTGLAVVAIAAAALTLSACGSSKKSSSTSNQGTAPSGLAVSVAESGKTAKYTVPATTKGGVTTLSLTNNGKKPYGAQLLRLLGSHTPQDALKVIGSQSNKIPDWLRAEGGLGSVRPGQTASATLNLEPGKYLVISPPEGPGAGSGPPPYSEFTVTAGSPGSLPSTPTKITAAGAGKDKWRWDVSGRLRAGPQTVTFVSKGKKALHFIGVFRVTGNPSDAEILKALSSNGPPAKFVDQKSSYDTAVIDGEKSQTTPLPLSGPGKWVLFCAISDRDGGKPHFEEGLLKTVDVK